MPLLSTFGAASVRGFQGLSRPVVVGGTTIEEVLSEINTILSNTVSVNSSLSDYVSEIQSSSAVNFKVVASPNDNNYAETLSAQTGTTLNTWGRFLLDAWDNPQTLVPFSSSSGSGSSYPTEGNGYGAYYLISLITGDRTGTGTYRGTVAIVHNDDNRTILPSFFNNQEVNISAVVINSSNTQPSSYFSPQAFTVSTIFSDGAQFGSNGYFRTDRFSADDGVWGYGTNNVNRLDGNGGSYLLNSSQAYGFENRNSGDGVTNPTAFWNFDNYNDWSALITVVYA
jgi:hypothetical protein